MTKHKRICKAIGVSPSSFGVGKKIGDQIWVHKSALETMDIPHRDIIASKLNAEHCIARINTKQNTFQTSSCPHFDTEREPAIHGHKTYEIVNGKAHLLSERKYKGDNLLIFHHKHLFVLPTYTEFDVDESVKWSLEWKDALPKTRSITSKIGRRNNWIAILKNYGIGQQYTDKTPLTDK